MKKIYLLIYTLLFCCGAKAQALWERLPLKFNESNYSKLMYYDSVSKRSYIYGAFLSVNDTVCNLVRLNEDGSHTLMPSTPHFYTNCLLRHNDTLYAGGDQGLAYWNGSNWSRIDSTTVISSMLVYQGKLLIAGTYQNPSQTALHTWDGITWTENVYGTDTLCDGGGNHIAEYKGELYIAGNFNNASDTAIDEIARFDGTSWKSVGGQIRGDGLTHVTKMLVWNDTLYVTGQFKKTLGSPGNGIAQWDGQQWHGMGKGLNQSYPSATDMLVFNEALYVTGFFHDVNGMNPLPQIGKGFARWDGSKWCTMGTTANLQILNVGRTKDALFIMGNFEILNGDTIVNIAKWIGGDYTDTCSLALDNPTSLGGYETLSPSALNVFPNPSSGMLHITYFNQTVQRTASLKIVDVVGNVVSSSNLKIHQGNNQFGIDMTGVAAGLYILELHSGEQKSNAKFVKK